ncbi:MAG: hypothetical protein ACRDQU_20695 [Pseudonocardiaceae bacterium]
MAEQKRHSTVGFSPRTGRADAVMSPVDHEVTLAADLSAKTQRD